MKKKKEIEKSKASISWIKEQAKYYQPLKDGEATRELKRLIGEWKLYLGWDTYCTINHLLSEIKTATTLPTKTILSIERELRNCKIFSNVEIKNFLYKIEGKAKKKIRQWNEFLNEYRKQISSEALKRLYPELQFRDYKKKENIALDVLVFYLSKHLKGKKWELIAGFLDEQFELFFDIESLKKRVARIRYKIKPLYEYIYKHFPHGVEPFRKLPAWSGKVTEKEEVLAKYEYCKACRIKKNQLNCNNCNKEIKTFPFVLFPEE